MKKLLFALFISIIAYPLFSQWTLLNSGTANNLYSVHFITDSIGFVAGANGTVLKTTNAGDTWTDIYPDNTDLNSVFAIDEDTIYVGGDGLYKTTDGGLTWIDLNVQMQISNIQFFDAQNGIFYGNYIAYCQSSAVSNSEHRMNLMKTSDYGNTWTISMNGFIFNEFQLIDSDIGYIVSKRGYFCFEHCDFCHDSYIYKTTDKGNTWTNQFPYSNWSYGASLRSGSFINDSVGFVLSFNKLMKTTDSGNSFITVYNGTINGHSMKFLNEIEGYYLLQNNIYKTTSEGVVWNTDYTEPTTTMLYSTYYTDNNYAYVVGNNGVILRNILNPATVPDSIYNITVDPASIDFGLTSLNIGQVREFDIRNNGNMDLAISLSAPANFEIMLEGDSIYTTYIDTFILPMGGEKTILVNFQPQVEQIYSDTIFIYSNATNTPVYELNVTGNCTSYFLGIINSDLSICTDTIRIIGDITVNQGAKLYICPGTVVEMLGDYSIEVFGQIIADGQLNDTIIFTTNDSLITWDGIIYNNDEGDTSVFQYCIIERSSNAGIRASQYLNNSNIQISNCIFRNNDIGVSLYKSRNSYIKNCEIYNNNNMGVKIKRSSLCNVINCNIYNNNRGIYIDLSDTVYVEKCKIHNNISDYGAGIYCWASIIFVTNNYIYNNEAIGINSSAGAIYIALTNNLIQSMISENLIFNNYAIWGGGISCDRASPLISNNTICNNYAEHGGGIACYGSNDVSNPVSFNNILYWNNTEQIYVSTQPQCNPIFSYCNIEGGQQGINGLNNIDQDPRFMNPTNQIGPFTNDQTYNWAIKTSSPCVNNGYTNLYYLQVDSIDFYGNPRISDSIIDIGAYENQFQQHPSDTSLCAGESISFIIVPNESIFNYYQWFFNGNEIIGATNNILTINNSSNINSGMYSCIIYNQSDTIMSYPIELLVDSLGPFIISQSQDEVINCGDTIVLFVESENNPFYQWYKNGLILTNENSSEYTINNTSLVNVGTYNCLLTNGCASISSSPIELSINNAPFVNLGNDITISETQTVIISGGNNLPNYLWNTGETSAQLVVFGDSLGVGTYEYWLYSEGTNGCSSSDTIVITVTSNIGVEDVNNNEGIDIFPNPTTGHITIENEEYSIQNVCVYDIYGKEVLNTEVGIPKTEVDLSTQPNGIYIIKVQTDSGMYYLKCLNNK